jgi:hypothetical protein
MKLVIWIVVLRIIATFVLVGGYQSFGGTHLCSYSGTTRDHNQKDTIQILSADT